MVSENGRENSRGFEIVYGLLGIVFAPLVSLNEVRKSELSMTLDCQDDLLSGRNSYESVMKSHRERAVKYERTKEFLRGCSNNYRECWRKVRGNGEYK